ncbi:pyroglutamyl-peptidase I [Zhihengliuella sp.]|uniref:pyroglutamyl-peptidase I n=1 Tax=Zhihengliuella sp. TaxID=1954483 RepID=UPI002810B109|nr:pyroglutamyl-peptidase I [Zhihengliuella sp.]
MILLTGFEPFDGAETNPSAEAAQLAAHQLMSEGTDAVAVVLPCTFGLAGRRLREAVEETNADVVLATGVAAERRRISLEEVAVNRIEARIPDNAGAQPVGVPCVPGAPEEYPSTLPLERILAKLELSGLPAERSDSAGRYVCNQAFFELMHHASAGAPRVAGFIHVPAEGTPYPDGADTEEAVSGAWTVGAMARALEIAAKVSMHEARHPGDDMPVSSASSED